MQKKLIALAVAAAFSAPAFADVSVYGVVDAALVHVSADGQKSDIQAVSGGLASSRIGVTGAEDLNNGMKAVVKLEYALDTETSAGIGAARQQMLAIAGDFGTFATGYLQTTGYDFGVRFDPMAGSAVSPLSVTSAGFIIGDNAVAKRAQRALAYISPDMAGVTVAVNYTTAFPSGLGNLGVADACTGAAPTVTAGNTTTPACTAGSLKTTAYLLSATYTGVQNLAVGGVYAATKDDNAGADNAKEYALGASYDLSVVKLFATYQSLKVDNSNASLKTASASVVAPVGPGAVAFSYSKNSKDAGDAKGMTVAWLQGLSKTTTFYAALEKVSQGDNSASYSVLNNALGGITSAQAAAMTPTGVRGSLNAGGSSTLLAVGLNKKF